MNNRIKPLDSLRGISSLIVVIFHCLISYSIFYYAIYDGEYTNKFLEVLTVSPLRILWAGNEAVLLFFILSGFVLTLPFLNNRYNGYTEFAIKRFFRIYIPYIILMLISAALVMLFYQYNTIDGMSPAFEKRWVNDVSLLSIISYFLMLGYDTTNVNGVVWSLNHEMRISLILPLVVLLMIKFEWKKAMFAALFFTSIIVIGLTTITNNLVLGKLLLIFLTFTDTFYYLAFFILGITLARKKDDVVRVVSKYSSIKKFIFFVVSLLLINSRWLENFELLQYKFITDALAGIGIIILLSLVLSSGKLDKFLSKKPLQFLGDISYSLYMVHIPVMMITTIGLHQYIPLWVAFILVPIFSIPVAWLSYKYLEKPSIEWGRNIILRRRNKIKIKKEIAETVEQTASTK